jgi:putative tricarboxylic transport membrane protein
MVLFGGSLGLQAVRSQEAWASEWLRGRGLLNALFILGATIAYILVVDALGFLLTATLLLFLLMCWLHVRAITAAMVAVLLALGSYILFARILLVPLPRGPLGW